MRATTGARSPALPLLALALLGVTFHLEAGDAGADGTVRGGGVSVCVEPGIDQELVNTCLQTRFCIGMGLDEMSGELCPPID